MIIGDVVCISCISNTMMFGVCVCLYIYNIIYMMYMSTCGINPRTKWNVWNGKWWKFETKPSNPIPMWHQVRLPEGQSKEGPIIQHYPLRPLISVGIVKKFWINCHHLSSFNNLNEIVLFVRIHCECAPRFLETRTSWDLIHAGRIKISLSLSWKEVYLGWFLLTIY